MIHHLLQRISKNYCNPETNMCSSGVRYQCGQPNVNLRKEAEKNERILQESESCIKQIPKKGAL